MKMIKRRIAIFLCMLMAFTTVAAFVPETAQAGEKATYNLWGTYSFYSGDIKLEDADAFLVIAKGMKGISAVDFLSGAITTAQGEFQYIEGKDLTGVKYVSGNPEIVSVNSKTGALTAKKTGEALIKATWKGQKVCAAIRVVDAKTIKSYQKENKTAITMAKKLDKIYAGKVTAQNAVKLAKQMNAVWQKGYQNIISDSKFDSDNNYLGTDFIIYSEATYKAAMVINQAITSYFSDINPFSTYNTCSFKISAISGKGTEVKATLSKKVTTEQMYGAEYLGMWGDSSVLGKDSYTFDIYVRNVSSNDIISAKATIKKGSKNMTIKCDSALTKGTKYELIQSFFYDEELESECWTHQGKCLFTAK